jgi:hypothetical protein
MTYNKIGFLAGVGGNPGGIGDYVRTLDANGKPAVIFCNDGTTGLSDVFALGDTAVPHVMAFRVVVGDGTGGIESHSVPPYHAEPQPAAEYHWNKIRPYFPPAVVENRERVWIFPINEVDKTKADWLGRFGVELARIANAEGFKVAMFGFASGEPEPEHWHTAGMIEYLEYCEANPDMAGVCLHEYSYSVDEIDNGYPHLIGRFQRLHDACDFHGIARPKILIGEWGWTMDRVPDWVQCMQDIEWAAELYAEYDNILGAGIWYLGPYLDIADKVQPLIRPVTDFSLTAVFDPPLPPPPVDPPPEEKHTAIVVKLPQDMSRAEWVEMSTLAYPFRHTVTASHDDMLTVLQGGNDNSYVKFTHPERDGAAVALVEFFGYRWERFGDEPDPPPVPPPEGVEIDVIVDDLPQHPTKDYLFRDMAEITHLTIHHTVSPPDRPIWGIAQYHVDVKDWPGIGYHYVIGADGKISQTNYLTTKSYHAGSYAAPGDENLFSVGIALQGDFTTAPPPQAQLDGARALVEHLREHLPNPLTVVGHRQMPGAATACPGYTFESWMPYIVGDDAPPPPPPPPPPPAASFDLVEYMFPTAQRIYEVRHPDGSQERIQTQHGDVPGVAYIVKGENQGFWEMWAWDNNYIYLVRDTSPGPDGVFYDVRTADGQVTPWCKRHMRPGETYSDGGHVVTFKGKSDCRPIVDSRSGNATNLTTFIDHYDRYVFDTGLQLDDCVMIQGNTEEHVFARGFGRVAWYAPWGDSEVSEIHQPGARPNIRRETGCFGG